MRGLLLWLLYTFCGYERAWVWDYTQDDPYPIGTPCLLYGEGTVRWVCSGPLIGISGVYGDDATHTVWMQGSPFYRLERPMDDHWVQDDVDTLLFRPVRLGWVHKETLKTLGRAA